jgi:hypothetical protein
MTAKVSCDKDNDYPKEIAQTRRDFVAEQTETKLNDVGKFSFEPNVLRRKQCKQKLRNPAIIIFRLGFLL